MAVMIAEAVHDERSRYSGGMAGDQTGGEVRIRQWYSRPWNFVVRATMPAMREKIAKAMESAAGNPHIGYDQNQRNTVLFFARTVGYDPGRIPYDCECDCSSLVTLACIYAGIPEDRLFMWNNSATTTTLRNRLSATGLFQVLSGHEYVGQPGKLIRGDILLYEGHHTAVVTQGTTVAKKTVEELARECVAGKWGDGMERISALRAAGYDADAVRAEVNRLLGK